MPIHFDHTGDGILTIKSPASGVVSFEGAAAGATPPYVLDLATLTYGWGLTGVTHVADWSNATPVAITPSWWSFDSNTTLVGGFPNTFGYAFWDGLIWRNGFIECTPGQLEKAPYLVGSNGEKQLIVKNGIDAHHWFSTSDNTGMNVIVLHMASTENMSKYSTGDKVEILAETSVRYPLVIIATGHPLQGSNGNHTRRAHSDDLAEINPAFFGMYGYPSYNNFSWVFSFVGLDDEGAPELPASWSWSLESPSTYMPAESDIYGSWGNQPVPNKKGIHKRYTLSEAQYKDVEKIYYLDPLQTGPGLFSVEGTYASYIALQAARPARGWYALTDDPTRLTYWNGLYGSPGVQGITASRLATAPYVAGTNGENRIIILGDDDGNGEMAIIKMPGMTEAELANSFDVDYRIEIDGALSDGAMIIADEWQSTSTRVLWTSPIGPKDWEGVWLSVRRHMVLEYYGHPRSNVVPRTSHPWCAVGLHGLLLSTQNHDGWGNYAEQNLTTGFMQRFTLNERQYRSVLADAGFQDVNMDGASQSSVDISVNTSPFTYICDLNDVNIIHKFHGIDDPSLTIKLPDSANNNMEKWKFHFAHPVTPKFTTVSGAALLDGNTTVTPLSRCKSGGTYIEFQSASDAGSMWSSINNSTKEERVFELDPYTTGCWANDRGSVSSWTLVPSPVPGDSCYDTGLGAYHYFKGGVGFESWGSQNPALAPYVAMSSGENRIRLVNKAAGIQAGYGIAFIVLPSVGSGNATIETIAQHLTYDEPLHIDTAYEQESRGACILAGSWTNTEYAAQGNAKQLHKKYPSIPGFWAHRAGDAFNGGGFEFNENTHISFEPYPDDSTELPGARTRIRWCPTAGLGTLFKRPNEGVTDGWGNRVDIDRNGYATRYTLSDREWEDSASKLYTEIKTRDFALTSVAPYVISSEWDLLRDDLFTYEAQANGKKTHLVIDPSTTGDTNLYVGDAHFEMPDWSWANVGTKITFYNYTNNGGRRCIIHAALGNSFGGPSYLFPDDGVRQYYVHPTNSGVGITFTQTGSGWQAQPINMGGMEKRGWGNGPDLLTLDGEPARWTLTQQEYNWLSDPSIQIIDSTAGINWTTSFDLRPYLGKVIHLDLDVSNRTMWIDNIGNGGFVHIYAHDYNDLGYKLTLDPTMGGVYPGNKINGVGTLELPVNCWITLMVNSSTNRLYYIIAASHADMINGANTAGGGGGSRNIDGGSPDSIYLASQVIDGGNP
jgi:hypothetical protein